MTPREIDILIAEKVMNRDVFSIGGDPPHNLQEGFRDADGKGIATRVLAHYSTDISAAWEVVNQLHMNWDDAAPMAICLAALKAVGVEVEG